MKKILPAVTALILVSAVALTACGKKDTKPDNSTTSTSESTLKSTTNLSQKADEFTDDMKTTIDEMKSDVSEMMPGGDDTSTTAPTTENKD